MDHGMHQHPPQDHSHGDHAHGERSPEAPAPPIGVHGMLLVGDDPIYLLHLPMFMAPHNYQAILKVSLDGEASGRLKDFQAHFGRDFLYTVKPEEFSIVDLLPVGGAEPVVRTFTADVVKGHFEKGGDPIAEGARYRQADVGGERPKERWVRRLWPSLLLAPHPLHLVAAAKLAAPPAPGHRASHQPETTRFFWAQ